MLMKFLMNHASCIFLFKYWKKFCIFFFQFQGNMEYYCNELELNAKFHTFAKHNSIIHRGHNTVQGQTKFKSKRGKY